MSPRHSPNRSSLIIAGCLCVFVLTARAAFGQGTAASVFGQVTDESSGVLPGVTVTAKSPALQTAAVTAVTDAEGQYRLSPLAIGSYTIEYALQGFQAVRHEDVRLTVGFAAKLDVVLKLGAVAETITVSGAAPTVDVTSSAASTQFTRETLEITPSSRNGIISLIAQAPGVRTVLDVGGTSFTSLPSFRAFGQGGESWTVIEGVATTALQGSGGNGNYWDYGAVEEARVQTLGNEAAMPTRGVQVIAVVKSGGNGFHGNASWGQMSRHLQSNNIDDLLTAQGITTGNRLQTRWDGSGEIGGRIVRDKLWFFVTGRSRRDISEVLGAFKPDGSVAVNDRKQHAHTEKVSYQASPANRLLAFYSRNRKRDFSLPNRFTAWESRPTSTPITHTYKAEWQVVPTSSLTTSVQYGFWDFTEGPRPRFTDNIATFDRGTQLVTGEGAQSADIVYNRRHHARGDMTWYAKDPLQGGHEIQAGVEYMSNDGARANDPRTSGNYRLIFNNTAALQIETYNYPTYPHQEVNYVGFYGQDSWTIGRRLTLNLGARYTHEDGHVPASCRDAALSPSDIWAPAACFDRVQFNVWKSLSPRLGFAYDLTGDGKTAVKGGWGRFHHMRQIAPEVEQADPRVKATSTYRWRDLNNNRAFDTGEVNFDPNGTDFVSRSGGSNQVPNPEERQPKSDEFSLTVERELLANMAVRVTGVYSRTSDVYRLQNTLRPPAVYSIPVTRPDPGPDGLVGSSDDPGSFITYREYPAALAGQRFELFMLSNDEGATQRFRSVEIAGSKRFTNGWQLNASYSATKKDIPIVDGLNPSEFNSTVYAGAADPNAEIFASDRTWEWLGRVSGAYTFPKDVMVSASLEHRSGIPWARQVLFTGGTLSSITLRVEPIGSRRLPNTNLLDLRVQKALSLPNRHKVTLRANIYNALNINTATSLTMLSGSSFSRTLAIVPPRILELSVSYAF